MSLKELFIRLGKRKPEYKLAKIPSDAPLAGRNAGAGIWSWSPTPRVPALSGSTVLSPKKGLSLRC